MLSNSLFIIGASCSRALRSRVSCSPARHLRVQASRQQLKSRSAFHGPARIVPRGLFKAAGCSREPRQEGEDEDETSPANNPNGKQSLPIAAHKRKQPARRMSVQREDCRATNSAGAEAGEQTGREENNRCQSEVKVGFASHVSAPEEGETVLPSEQVDVGKMTTRQEGDANDEHKRTKQQLEEDSSKALAFACAAIYTLVPLASLVTSVGLIWLLFTSYWPVTCAYCTYLLLDSKKLYEGGGRVESVYKSKFWTHLAANFPVRLSYSPEFKLDPNENYILDYHPHGIYVFGCVSAFATNALNFSQLFPGITARFMVHDFCLLLPVLHEAYYYRGDCSVNSQSFDYILSRKWRPSNERKRKAGNLLALCGGGIDETDLSDAKCLKVLVAKRKGYVKKALVHGAHLIPCIGFGENSALTKVNLKPGSLGHKLERQIYNLFKFKQPLYYGCSAFFGNKGLLPYRRPITIAMGNPIQVARVPEPSQAQIDELHASYVVALRELYASNKHLCTEYDCNLELL